MVVSACGAVLIATAKKVVAGPQPTTKGDLLVFLSMFAAMVIILLSKHLMTEYGALQFTAWMIGIGTVILLPAAPLMSECHLESTSRNAYCAGCLLASEFQSGMIAMLTVREGKR
jgi:drug/metabolite transporter (DMT)-like permease